MLHTSYASLEKRFLLQKIEHLEEKLRHLTHENMFLKEKNNTKFPHAAASRRQCSLCRYQERCGIGKVECQSWASMDNIIDGKIRQKAKNMIRRGDHLYEQFPIGDITLELCIKYDPARTTEPRHDSNGGECGNGIGYDTESIRIGHKWQSNWEAYNFDEWWIYNA